MTSSVPLVTVLMPVYNAAPYLEQAIRSILEQTFEDFEFLIINDGSKDASGEIIQSFKDKRIVFINHEKNSGIVVTLNEGLTAARGKYIARMDNDDISLPRRFEEQIAFMESHPEVGVCGTAFAAFGSNETVYKMPVNDPEIRAFMLMHNPIGHPTVMMRTSVVREYGIAYRESDTPAEDYRMWYDLSKVTQLHNLPDTHLYYRTHASQMSSSMNGLQKEKVNKVRVLQLIDNGFDLTVDEQKMYCRILDADSQFQGYSMLTKVLKLMNKIYAQNLKLNAFNSSVISELFSVRWALLVNSIKKHYPVHSLLAFQAVGPYTEHWRFKDRVKFIGKSLLFW